ncbi:MAG: hypothetical protein KW806_01590 [Candidatus Yanofskybacteria bacterium]|nr:hypothetical protein [Candidatus Yanofskybacteria bacterium]
MSNGKKIFFGFLVMVLPVVVYGVLNLNGIKISFDISRFRADSPGNVKNYGYYWGGSDPFVPNAYYLNEVAPYTNFVELNLWDTNIAARAAEMKQKGMKVMMPLSGCFFKWFPGNGEHWGLDPDWPSKWANCRNTIDTQVLPQTNIFAFYVMDEPIGNGITIPELQTAINAAKGAYPTVKIYINESQEGPNRPAFAIPQGVDIYSLTCFDSLVDCKAVYNRLKTMYSGEIWVVGFAYSGYTDVNRIQQTWDWVKGDSRFTGMYWFLYADANGQCETIPNTLCGARHYPAIKDRIALLANDVLCNNTWDSIPVCGSNNVTYTNPDKAKCAGISTFTYGTCAGPTATPTPACTATAPSGLITTNVTTNSAQLTWTLGAGGVSQFLRVGPNLSDVQTGCAGGTCVLATTLPNTATSQTVPNLNPSTTYHWRVVNFKDAACYQDAISSFTTAAFCPATPPANMQATSITTSSARLSWTPGTGGTTQLLRVGPSLAEVNSGCPAGNGPTACVVVENNLSPTVSSYQIGNILQPSANYYWRVVTLKDAACYQSTVSNFLTATATPTPGPSSTPTPTPTGTVTPTPTPTNTSSPTPTPTGTFTPTPTPSGSPIPSNNPPPPTQFGLKEGDMISAINTNDPDIYIVNVFGYKRLFLNPVIFNFYGHLGGYLGGWGNVKTVTSTVRDVFPTSGIFRNCETNDPKVWAVEVIGEDIGLLHHVQMTGEEAVREDPNFFKKVFCINNNEYFWYPKSSVPYTSLSQIPIYRR